MIRTCCVCHRVEQQGKWHAGLILSGPEPLTHVYCPDCFINVMAEIEEFCGIAARKMAAAPARSKAGGRKE